MSEKLRNCPFCREGLIIDERFENNQVARKYACGHLTIESVPIPKYETVTDWETRTGEIYPTDGPVWTFYLPLMEKNSGVWELETWVECKGWEWDNIKPTVVANHHGRPPKGEYK